MNDIASYEEKEGFFDILGEIAVRIPKRKELIILGNLNSRVRNGEEDVQVRNFGENVTNYNGKTLLHFCREYEYNVTTLNHS